MSQPTLKNLLSPIEIPAFLKEFWEQKPLHVSRSDKNYYAEILALEHLDEYLSRNDIRYPSLRMIRKGKAVPIGDFSRPLRFGSYAADGLVDVDRVYELYQGGASLVLQLMRSSIASVSKFANRLQRDLRFNVETTIYVTPPSEQGFTTHYDTHSVMVLQIAGSKRWRLYDFPKTYPLLSDTFDTVKYTPPPPSTEIILNPGDLLYVPRGLAHDATSTGDCKSVHITVGLFPPMWRDLFETRIQQLKQDVRFRHAPIAHFLSDRLQQFEAERRRMCHEAFAGCTANEVLAATRRQHVRRQSRMVKGLPTDSHNEANLKPSTIVCGRDDIATEIDENNKTLSVHFYDKKLVLPSAARPALEKLLSCVPVAINEIQRNLDETSSIFLVRKFLDAGLIEVVLW